MGYLRNLSTSVYTVFTPNLWTRCFRCCRKTITLKSPDWLRCQIKRIYCLIYCTEFRGYVGGDFTKFNYINDVKGKVWGREQNLNDCLIAVASSYLRETPGRRIDLNLKIHVRYVKKHVKISVRFFWQSYSKS